MAEERLDLGGGRPRAPSGDRRVVQRFDAERIPEQVTLAGPTVADDDRVVAVNGER